MFKQVFCSSQIEKLYIRSIKLIFKLLQCLVQMKSIHLYDLNTNLHICSKALNLEKEN